MLVRCCFEESVIFFLGGAVRLPGVGPTFGSSLLEGD